MECSQPRDFFLRAPLTSLMCMTKQSPLSLVTPLPPLPLVTPLPPPPLVTLLPRPTLIDGFSLEMEMLKMDVTIMLMVLYYGRFMTCFNENVLYCVLYCDQNVMHCSAIEMDKVKIMDRLQSDATTRIPNVPREECIKKCHAEPTECQDPRFTGTHQWGEFLPAYY